MTREENPRFYFREKAKKNEELNGNWKGVKITKGAPSGERRAIDFASKKKEASRELKSRKALREDESVSGESVKLKIVCI